MTATKTPSAAQCLKAAKALLSVVERLEKTQDTHRDSLVAYASEINRAKHDLMNIASWVERACR